MMECYLEMQDVTGSFQCPHMTYVLYDESCFFIGYPTLKKDIGHGKHDIHIIKLNQSTYVYLATSLI